MHVIFSLHDWPGCAPGYRVDAKYNRVPWQALYSSPVMFFIWLFTFIIDIFDDIALIRGKKYINKNNHMRESYLFIFRRL